jgi:flagellar biosynthesis GTPase FlhF
VISAFVYYSCADSGRGKCSFVTPTVFLKFLNYVKATRSLHTHFDVQIVTGLFKYIRNKLQARHLDIHEYIPSHPSRQSNRQEDSDEHSESSQDESDHDDSSSSSESEEDSEQPSRKRKGLSSRRRASSSNHVQQDAKEPPKKRRNVEQNQESAHTTRSEFAMFQTPVRHSRRPTAVTPSLSARALSAQISHISTDQREKAVQVLRKFKGFLLDASKDVPGLMIHVYSLTGIMQQTLQNVFQQVNILIDSDEDEECFN